MLTHIVSTNTRTLEEWTALSPEDRTLLRIAAKKENAYSRGYTKASWKRLPMAEKFGMQRDTYVVPNVAA